MIRRALNQSLEPNNISVNLYKFSTFANCTPITVDLETWF